MQDPVEPALPHSSLPGRGRREWGSRVQACPTQPWGRPRAHSGLVKARRQAARHLDADAGAGAALGTGFICVEKASGWESHSTQRAPAPALADRGHQALHLRSRMLPCSTHHTAAVFCLTSWAPRVGFVPPEHVALVPRRWDMATVGSSPVLRPAACTAVSPWAGGRVCWRRGHRQGLSALLPSQGVAEWLCFILPGWLTLGPEEFCQVGNCFLQLEQRPEGECRRACRWRLQCGPPPLRADSGVSLEPVPLYCRGRITEARGNCRAASGHKRR